MHESAFTFTDAGEGTNIYVGKTAPLASSRFVAVIDRGLPEEVRAALHRSLPAMIDFYTTRLGRLPFKPMLFASLDPDLFDVWAEFLSRARGGEPISQDTFLRTAAELGAVNAASLR